MAGKFELYQDKTGKFRFRLKAGNEQILATVQCYESTSTAMNNSPTAATALQAQRN